MKIIDITSKDDNAKNIAMLDGEGAWGIKSAQGERGYFRKVGMTEAAATAEADEWNRRQSWTSDHVVSVQFPAIGGGTVPRRFKFCIMPIGNEGRRITNGPLIPGPWAEAFGLATVIDNHGGTRRESDKLKAEGLEHEAEIGDVIRIDGADCYKIAPDHNQNIKLLPAIVCPHCSYDGSRPGQHGGTFRILYDEVHWRSVELVGAELHVDECDASYEETTGDRLECRECSEEFSIPNNVSVEWN